jgi:hypothetical protein
MLTWQRDDMMIEYLEERLLAVESLRSLSIKHHQIGEPK